MNFFILILSLISYSHVFSESSKANHSNSGSYSKSNEACEDIHDVSDLIQDEKQRELFSLLFKHKESFELGKCQVSIECKHWRFGENNKYHSIYFNVDADQGDGNPSGVYLSFLSEHGSPYELNIRPDNEEVDLKTSKRTLSYRSEYVETSFPAKLIDKLTFNRQTGEITYIRALGLLFHLFPSVNIKCK